MDYKMLHVLKTNGSFRKQNLHCKTYPGAGCRREYLIVVSKMVGEITNMKGNQINLYNRNMENVYSDSMCKQNRPLYILEYIIAGRKLFSLGYAHNTVLGED